MQETDGLIQHVTNLISIDEGYLEMRDDKGQTALFHAVKGRPARHYEVAS